MKRLVALASIGLLAGVGLAGFASGASAAGPKLVAAPNPATEDTTGGVSWSVQGSGLPPHIKVKEHAPSLNIACATNNFSGTTLTVDFNGRFNDFDSATHCAPGTYLLQASELSSPFQTFTVALTIKPPAAGVRDVHTSPASVHEDDNGKASFSVIGTGLPVGSHFKLESPALDAACPGNTLSGTVVTVDFTGGFNFSAVGFACSAGHFVIAATEIGAPHLAFNTSITILAP